MKLKDIYKKIDSLNEAVNMSISMSGETADAENVTKRRN